MLQGKEINLSFECPTTKATPGADWTDCEIGAQFIQSNHALFSRLSRLTLAAFLATLVAACSSLNLQSAVSLGNTGIQAATTYQQAILVLSPGLDNFMEGQYMLAALNPDKYSPPTDSLRDSINKLQSALSARAELLGQLAQVYTGLIALVSFDATGQVKTSLSALDGAINNYATVLGASTPVILTVADAAITDTGGFFTAEYQKRAVLKASKAISARLKTTIDLFADENAIYAGLQDEITRGLRDSALALWQHGIGAPDAILVDQIGMLGLTYSPGSYSHACANDDAAARAQCQARFNDAITQAIRYRASRTAALQAETMKSNQSALAGLVAAHEQLEKGQPLDLAAVTQQLALIRGIIDDINNARKK